MYENGAQLEPEKPLYRDHVVLYVDDYTIEDLDEDRHRIVSFYQLYHRFLPIIKKKFTAIRSMLFNSDAAAVRPYFYINKTYYRVHLARPYINYCYMPLRMPPERTDIFTSDKFCALEQQISPELSTKFEQQVSGGPVDE